MDSPMKKVFYQQRADFIKESTERNSTLHMPDGITELTDISYIPDGTYEHRLDIYRPSASGDKVLPVIINIHGGGLIIGNKEFNRYFCGLLCKKGYMVYSIEYRLIPDCRVYDQFYDIHRAFDFIKNDIPSRHGDTERIYSVADSGGAYLLTYCAAMLFNRHVAKAAHIKPSDIKLNSIALISGMFYTTRFDKIGLFLPRFLYGAGWRKSSFARYVRPSHKDVAASLPPALFITSRKDNLRKYTLDFYKAASAYSDKHILLDYDKNERLTHAFSVFHPFMDESIEVINKINEFFMQY